MRANFKNRLMALLIDECHGMSSSAIIEIDSDPKGIIAIKQKSIKQRSDSDAIQLKFEGSIEDHSDWNRMQALNLFLLRTLVLFSFGCCSV
jgi:hypothetical protein